jgi:hypothetical protein
MSSPTEVIREPASPGLRLDGVRLANAEWSKQPDMIETKRLEPVVAVQPLLCRQLRISLVLLDGVEPWLETDARGPGHWVMKGQPQTLRTLQPWEAGTPMAIDLAQAETRESTITSRDGKTGRTEALGLQRVLLTDAGPTDRLDCRHRDPPYDQGGRPWRGKSGAAGQAHRQPVGPAQALDETKAGRVAADRHQ